MNKLLSIAKFMQYALYDDDKGYYKKSNPIGENGDFITAPEVSQLFGEMLGIFVANQWLVLGKPAKYNLIELGPGRGTLLDDILRATKHIEGFWQATNLNLLEINQNLITSQKAKLLKHNINCKWHSSIDDIPKDIPMIVIANEFFDCLPINQYILKASQWQEIYVDLEKKEYISQNIFSEKIQNLLKKYINAKENDIVEISFQAQEILTKLAQAINSVSGTILVIDYGYELADSRHNFNSTLQALKKHKYTSIFENIGEVDLTAHVDFGALKEIAALNKCKTHGTYLQGDFLKNLGIELRADILKRNANDSQKRDIDLALQRLISPDEMGDLFKVLIINSQL